MSWYRELLKAQWLGGRHDPAVLAADLIRHIGGVQPEYLFLPLYTVTQHLRSMGYC